MASYRPILNPGNEEIDDSAQSGTMSTDLEYDEEFEVLVKAYLHDMGYTSMRQAVTNIVYSILNAGLIALPFAASRAGIPVFIAQVIVISIVSGYTSIMVIAMANEQHVRTLEDLAECAFGPKGFIAVSVFQILYSFTLMCITLDVWAEIMTDVFSETTINCVFLNSRQGQVLVGAGLVLPLCILKKSMSSLRWTSYLAVFAVAAALLGVVTTYVTDRKPGHQASTQTVIHPRSTWMGMIFVIAFCYSYNQKAFMVYSCLRRRTAKRWQTAVQRANVIISFIYIVFGVFGYVSKERIHEEIKSFNYFIDNKDENRVVFDIARIIVASSLLMTIPVDGLVAATTCRRLYSKVKTILSNPHDSADRDVDKDQSELKTNICCELSKMIRGPDVESPFEEAANPLDKDQPRTVSKTPLVVGEGAVASPPSSPMSPSKRRQKTPTKERHRRKRDGYDRRKSGSMRKSTSQSFNTNSSHSSLFSLYRTLFSSGNVSAQNPTSTAVAGSSYSINSSAHSAKEKSTRTDRDSHVSSLIAAVHEGPADSSELRAGQEDWEVWDELSYASRGAKPVQDSLNLYCGPDEATHRRTTSTEHESSYSSAVADRKHAANRRSVSFADDDVDGGKVAREEEFSDEEEDDEDEYTGPRLETIAEERQSSGSSFVPRESGVKLGPVGGRAPDEEADEARALRQSSTGDVGDFDEEPRCCPTKHEVVPALLLWLLCALVCLGIEKWVYLATPATVTTVMLLFIFPSMFYFRLGVSSDYQAIPRCGVIPNRFYMLSIQLLGICLLIVYIVMFLMLVSSGDKVMKHEN